MPKTRRLIPIVAIITGLLLVIGASGISCCECSSWGPVTVTWDGSPPETWTDNCEGFLAIPSISLGTSVLVSSSIHCIPIPPSSNCTPSYTWEVTKILGTAEGPWNGAGLPASFSPAYPGCFTVELKATCANVLPKVCPPCTTTICICDIAYPGLCCCDIIDMAVANDGSTIYVICGGKVYKSPDGGCNFAECASPPWVAAGVGARLIAVAPDNPNAIAVVDSGEAAANVAAGTVWISNNGCTTWAALPHVPGNAAGTASVRDIAVGPARAGCLLSRDYVVTVADTRGASMEGGDVWYTGFTTAWTSCTVPVAVGTPILDANANNNADDFDFTSLAMSPGFVGDRTVAVVGSDNVEVAGGVAQVGPPGESYLFLIRLSDPPAPAPIVIAPPGAVLLDTANNDSPADLDLVGAANSQIATSCIALPADFDPTIATGMRTFVSWTSRVAAGVRCYDDVYRVDFLAVEKLESGSTNGIWSIAYNGMISGGTLIAGEEADAIVWSTPVPALDWHSASTPGGESNTVVGINPMNSNICYAGTSGTGSCFFISTDGAQTFDLP